MKIECVYYYREGALGVRCVCAGRDVRVQPGVTVVSQDCIAGCSIERMRSRLGPEEVFRNISLVVKLVPDCSRVLGDRMLTYNNTV